MSTFSYRSFRLAENGNKLDMYDPEHDVSHAFIEPWRENFTLACCQSKAGFIVFRVRPLAR